MNFKNIVKTLLLLILILSMIFKLIQPFTFLAWINGILNQLNFLNSESIKIISIIGFGFIIYVELSIILSYRKVIFSYYALSFFGIIFVISIVLFLLNVKGDCGCFGEIIVFENTIDKILMNAVFTILSILLFNYERKTYE